MDNENQPPLGRSGDRIEAVLPTASKQRTHAAIPLVIHIKNANGNGNNDGYGQRGYQDLFSAYLLAYIPSALIGK